MAAETLEIYAEILELSRRMLTSAQSGQWDELVAQESERQKAVGKLKKLLENAARLPIDIQAKANALIQEILKLDEETRILTESCMADIRESLAAVGVSKQLNNTYLRP